MLDIASISTIIAAITVAVGVIYYILDLQHQRKVRQTDLMVRLQQAWGSEEMIKPWLKIMNLEFTNYDDFKKKYGALYAERPEHEAFLSVANHFIAVGYLLKRKMMDYETGISKVSASFAVASSIIFKAPTCTASFGLITCLNAARSYTCS